MHWLDGLMHWNALDGLMHWNALDGLMHWNALADKVQKQDVPCTQ